MTDISIVHYDAKLHKNIAIAVVNLHIDAILHDNCLIRYHPPFDSEKRDQMAEWWQKRLDVENPFCTTLLAFSTTQTDSTLVGIVQLLTPMAETGPFRADIEMLIISPEHQGKGIGKRLMKELEQHARQCGGTLLRLVTTKGSVADEYLYPKLGYTKFGELPRYGIEPVTRKLVDGVWFYKDLREDKTIGEKKGEY